MTGLFQSHTPVFKLLSAVCDVLSTISASCFESLNVIASEINLLIHLRLYLSLYCEIFRVLIKFYAKN